MRIPGGESATISGKDRGPLQQVQIDLESSLDTYLFLLQGDRTDGSVVTSDDDGGNGANSRIIRTLDPGSYTVEATTFDTARTGSFTLSVR